MVLEALGTVRQQNDHKSNSPFTFMDSLKGEQHTRDTNDAFAQGGGIDGAPWTRHTLGSSSSIEVRQQDNTRVSKVVKWAFLVEGHLTVTKQIYCIMS
jgi:hypothetical protein